MRYIQVDANHPNRPLFLVHYDDRFNFNDLFFFFFRQQSDYLFEWCKICSNVTDNAAHNGVFFFGCVVKINFGGYFFTGWKVEQPVHPFGPFQFAARDVILPASKLSYFFRLCQYVEIGNDLFFLQFFFCNVLRDPYFLNGYPPRIAFENCIAVAEPVDGAFSIY